MTALVEKHTDKMKFTKILVANYYQLAKLILIHI